MLHPGLSAQNLYSCFTNGNLFSAKYIGMKFHTHNIQQTLPNVPQISFAINSILSAAGGSARGTTKFRSVIAHHLSMP